MPGGSRGPPGWGEQGSGVPPFPNSPEGGSLGLAGVWGGRQRFLRELLAVIPCSRSLKLWCPGAGVWVVLGCPCSGNPLEIFSGLLRARAPPAAAASGEGAGFHNGSVLPWPCSSCPAPSCPEKPRNWFVQNWLPSPAPPAQTSRSSGAAALSPAGVTAPSPPWQPKTPKSPSPLTPLLPQSRCCRWPGSPPTASLPWPRWNSEGIAPFPLPPAVLICFFWFRY